MATHAENGRDNLAVTPLSRHRFLDVLVETAVGNLVVLGAGNDPSSFTAHVIRTTTGVTGNVELFQRHPGTRFHGVDHR